MSAREGLYRNVLRVIPHPLQIRERSNLAEGTRQIQQFERRQLRVALQRYRFHRNALSVCNRQLRRASLAGCKCAADAYAEAVATHLPACAKAHRELKQCARRVWLQLYG